MQYTYTAVVPASWEEAVAKTKAALAAQGFGVLSEINVRDTFAAKLGEDAAAAVGDYVILGACNPHLAGKALAAEPELGALLPCNVVVRRGAGEPATTVQAIDPQTMVQLSDSDAVREVADAVGLGERQLRRRSLAAFGYGPKTLQRVLRFQRALGLARSGMALADVAQAAGYADQPHLANEVRVLAGVPVRALL